MTLTIARVRTGTPELSGFLADHLRDLEPTAPPESRHARPLAALLCPDVRLFAVTLDGVLAGTGALAALEPDHEELKSMRTAPSFRGRGVAVALLRALLADARARGIQRVSLETGSSDFFRPARRLYERAGFRPSGPFGGYAPDPHSVFLTLALAPAPDRASVMMAG